MHKWRTVLCADAGAKVCDNGCGRVWFYQSPEPRSCAKGLDQLPLTETEIGLFTD
jgi:hypothetical protein